MAFPTSFSRRLGWARVLGAWLVAAAWMGPVLQAQPVTLAVRLESGPQGPVLVVPPVAARGLLLVASAGGLAELRESPDLLFHTNTPVTTELRVPLPASTDPEALGFLRASHWAGLVPALVPIPAGTFLMGSPPTEPERSGSEGPVTRVTVSRSFRMGRFEVTQAEYRSVMGNNPSYFIGNTNRPVDQVNWTNAATYCARLTSSLQGGGVLPRGWVFRLPTEAEWEYACRAGRTTPFGLGPALRSGMANFNGFQEYDAVLGTQNNPNGLAPYQSTVGGRYPANAWGLHDMHGNLWEWCLDTWQGQLPGRDVTDPLALNTGVARVIRGGCWYTDGRFTRSATRSQANPTFAGNEMGFRVVLAREAGAAP